MGWNLTTLKLNDEELKEATAYFQDYVDGVPWTFAKTMKYCPHEYTVRWKAPHLDAEFCKFAQFIHSYGYEQYYYGRLGMYFDLGPHKYWTMGAPIRPSNWQPRNENTFIMNRADKTHIYGAQL